MYLPDSELQLDSACASGFSSVGEDTTCSNSEDSSEKEAGGESEPEYESAADSEECLSITDSEY